MLKHGSMRLKNHLCHTMKLWTREQNLVGNILKLKYPHQVTSEHVQTVYVLGRSELTKIYGREQEPCLILGSRGDISLKLWNLSLVRLSDKRNWLMATFFSFRRCQLKWFRMCKILICHVKIYFVKKYLWCWVSTSHHVWSWTFWSGVGGEEVGVQDAKLSKPDS